MQNPGFETSDALLAKTPFRALSPFIERWAMDGLAKARQGAPHGGETFFDDLLKSLKIGCECAPEDLDRVPVTGPLLVVANHPFGLAEGIVLGSILSKIRPDFRFLANSLLASIPGLENRVIPVNPFGGSQSVVQNRKPVRQCIDWLRSGGLLVAFPAGEVATFRFPDLAIADREWTANMARVSRLTGSAVLPMFFHGTNSPAFHVAGLIHPLLRTALLPHELLNKAGTTIRLSIGTPIPADRLAAASDPTEYVRGRTLMLEARAQGPDKTSRFIRLTPAKIVKPENPNLIEREIGNLPPDQLLVRHGEYAVYFTTADEIPHALREIGRLREITFRQSGEGTGKSIDLDGFDRYYNHLLLWNQTTREIVGAYRFAKTDEVIASFGNGGLYTNTLFRLKATFYRSIQPALELGRSFVRPEYQKSFFPLLLLWKGIGHYVARNSRYRTLFGPVSISQDYSPSSRDLIVSFVRSRCGNDELAAHIKPHNRFRTYKPGPCDPRNFSSLLSDLDELSEVVADIEPDHKKIPILLRHYLNLGGQVLDFRMDKNFSNVVDGLVVLDLAKVSRRQLERYMGTEKADQFLREHGTSQLTDTAA
jgi:putative hemolysin